MFASPSHPRQLCIMEVLKPFIRAHFVSYPWKLLADLSDDITEPSNIITKTQYLSTSYAATTTYPERTEHRLQWASTFKLFPGCLTNLCQLGGRGKVRILSYAPSATSPGRTEHRLQWASICKLFPGWLTNLWQLWGRGKAKVLSYAPTRTYPGRTEHRL